jgi:hypothetical protein
MMFLQPMKLPFVKGKGRCENFRVNDLLYVFSMLFASALIASIDKVIHTKYCQR